MKTTILLILSLVFSINTLAKETPTYVKKDMGDEFSIFKVVETGVFAAFEQSGVEERTLYSMYSIRCLGFDVFLVVSDAAFTESDKHKDIYIRKGTVYPLKSIKSCSMAKNISKKTGFLKFLNIRH